MYILVAQCSIYHACSHRQILVCAHLGRISHPAHSTEPIENHRQLSSVIEFSIMLSPGLTGCGSSHSNGVILKTVPQRSGPIAAGTYTRLIYTNIPKI